MAKFTVTNYDSIPILGGNGTGIRFAYSVSDLNYAWDTTHYQGILFTTSPFVSGMHISDPNSFVHTYGVISSMTSGLYRLAWDSTYYSSANQYSFTGWELTNASNTITIYPGLVQTSWYIWGLTSTGSVAQGSTVPGITLSVDSTRPKYFYWTYAKNSGGTFNLTAIEWNTLTANINQVRVYKGLTEYKGATNLGFTMAFKGNSFTAAMYNQAVEAIQEISGYGAFLSYVSPGDTIYASHLNNLVSELNAIP